MTSITLTRRSATLPLLVAALALATMAVLLESVFHVSVRLPGHRALPGALALLALAEAFAPLLMLALAAAIPAVLLAMGQIEPAAAIPWLVLAAGLALVGRRAEQHRVLLFLLAGAVFGLLRWLALLAAPHHTPEVFRMLGHVLFGGLGGAMALGAARLLTRRE